MVCPNCQKENTESSSFCKYCGTDLSGDFVHAEEGVPKRSGKKKVVIPVCIIGLMIALIGVELLCVKLIIPSSRFRKAEQLLQEQQFDEAYDILGQLGDFNDSDSILTKSKYDRALSFYKNEDYNQALFLLNQIKGFPAAEDLISRISKQMQTSGIIVPETSSASRNDSTQTTAKNSENTTEYLSDQDTEPIMIQKAKTVFGTELRNSNVSSKRSFVASNACDGDKETCWCINTDNEGAVGGAIQFDFNRAVTLEGFSIVNGNQYMPEDDLYNSNGQIRDFSIELSNGDLYRFSASYNDGNPDYEQIFYFPERVDTEYLILSIDSAYVGMKYKTNNCITEFTVF